MGLSSTTGISSEPVTRIRAFLFQTLREESVGDEDDIFATGLVNSLFAMQLVQWLEREFSIEIQDEDLELRNFSTVAALAALVERIGNRRASDCP
jgi:methoxymalonate biosynthesis acyl carrier protein